MKISVEEMEKLESVEALVGVPFHDESDTVLGVVRVAQDGLERAGLVGKSAVVCVGPAGSKCEAVLESEGEGLGDSILVVHIQTDQVFKGRGEQIRLLMEVASRYGSTLVLLPPNLVVDERGGYTEGSGFSPSWITSLIKPIQDQVCDLALARFCRDPLAHPVESLLVYPVVTAIFGLRLRHPTPDVSAFSAKLVRNCLSQNNSWHVELGDYGFDPWIVTHSMAAGMQICEVPLGVVEFRHKTGRLKRIFRQVTHVLLGQVKKHSKWWSNRSQPITTPLTSGPYLDVPPARPSFDRGELLKRFKREFDHFDDTLFKEIVEDELREEMEVIADREVTGNTLDARQWVTILSDFLIAYGFEGEFHPDDIVDGLYPFFLARLASFIYEIEALERSLKTAEGLPEERRNAIIRHEAARSLESQTEVFVTRWPEFRWRWQEKDSSTGPYLPKLGAWEFVPHVGVVLPQEMKGTDGNIVFANQVYQELIDRYRNEFREFVTNQLGLEEMTDSEEILERIHRFMRKLDWALDVDLFRVDLQTVKGAAEMAQQICKDFAPEETFQLKAEVIESILKRSPPSNLIMQTGFGNVSGLLARIDPNDALGMAAWTDRQHYLDNILDIIGRDCKKEWFERAPLKPMVVDFDFLPNASEVRGTAALARLAGRVMVGNYDKGWGGEFQKLWFFLKVIKSIMGVELFSLAWQDFAASGSDFAKRLIASIKGHWGRCVLSAHNAFENRHQRILRDRLIEYAKKVKERDTDHTETADLLEAAAKVYHLSITLPDATFVPLSAWTWASYSHRGGVKTPTPLSSLVERDWATRDFLTAYLKRTGIGDEKSIDDKIKVLMGQGRESEDLSHHLLGISADIDDLMVRQSIIPEVPQAGKLIRPQIDPILMPIAEHKWESRYVLNAATARLDGTIYILYRAFGEDKISRIGLAWTRDGINIDGRLKEPIFVPENPTESAGCEDPRVTVIGDRMYMLYTAWDGKVHQIAMASIPVQAFIEHRFDQWRRDGLGFPGLMNKDAVIYPETFDGKYVVYHRIDPNMWITYTETLDCPWPKTGAKIVVGPRPGMMWDGVKIGAGAQPLKTTHGWLNIYHGVDYERSYRLGVLMMDLKDPSKVIYQSPGPILEPETEFEIGKSDSCDFWVPQVVFTCGAVPAVDKEVIGIDDEIFVYYGAADTAIGMAKARLGDLVPIIR